MFESEEKQCHEGEFELKYIHESKLVLSRLRSSTKFSILGMRRNYQGLALTKLTQGLYECSNRDQVAEDLERTQIKLVQILHGKKWKRNGAFF